MTRKRPGRHRLPAIAVLLAVALLGGAACGGDAQEALVAGPPDRGAVGLAMPTKTSERWVADGENMRKQFELLGYRPELAYADNDIAAQVAQIEAMIKNGDKAVIIAAIDGTALKEVLAKATAAHIPVFAYDRLIRDSPDIAYYATFDNFKVGVQQASYIAEALGLARGARGPFTIELFAGSADDNNATFFFNGAMSVLKPYLASGALVVRSGETAFTQVTTQRWDGDIAKQRMQRLLAGPLAAVHVDAVLSPYDGISRGIIDALKAAGRGGRLPVVTGQDAELESVKLIMAGQQSQTVYKDTRELAKVAVQMTNAVLTGGSPEVNDTSQYDNGVKVVPTFLLQPVSVDRSNYRRVLVDGGYYTASQIGG
ncbi:sugar ABC transporter substrate-binding protein [Dactylosporangium sp. NBC_01737]|uniref:multiple monosaccharide ABC transporter substrate-binding protein n=1 Tax=Dactylosporangium sp. NBC_01737 TaxID=2975959 RepID=UPI002E14712B|nr:sugar ABC transporter substrate-binding protein [Dactylosporangium sp. NBC_01737]